jgi:hypothetical protein
MSGVVRQIGFGISASELLGKEFDEVNHRLEKWKSRTGWSVSLVYLALATIAYTLCIKYSKDWAYYLWWFGEVDRVSWQTWFTSTSVMREPLYNFLAKLIGGNLSFPVFVAMATFPLLFLKLRYLAKIVGNPYIAMFFYATLYLLLFEGTILRVAYATACIVPGLYFLQQRRYWVSLMWICLAGLIHVTAFVYLAIFLLYFNRTLNKLVFATFLLAPLLIIFDYSVLGLFRDSIAAINPRYLLYLDQKVVGQNSTGLYFYFIAFFSLLLLGIESLLGALLRSDQFALTLQRLAMLGVICMCAFHDYVAVGARFGEILLLPIVILLSWVFLRFDEQKHTGLKLAMIVGFTMYMLARAVYLYPRLWA